MGISNKFRLFLFCQSFRLYHDLGIMWKTPGCNPFSHALYRLKGQILQSFYRKCQVLKRDSKGAIFSKINDGIPKADPNQMIVVCWTKRSSKPISRCSRCYYCIVEITDTVDNWKCIPTIYYQMGSCPTDTANTKGYFPRLHLGSSAWNSPLCLIYSLPGSSS